MSESFIFCRHKLPMRSNCQKEKMRRVLCISCGSFGWLGQVPSASCQLTIKFLFFFFSWKKHTHKTRSSQVSAMKQLSEITMRIDRNNSDCRLSTDSEREGVAPTWIVCLPFKMRQREENILLYMHMINSPSFNFGNFPSHSHRIAQSVNSSIGPGLAHALTAVNFNCVVSIGPSEKRGKNGCADTKSLMSLSTHW